MEQVAQRKRSCGCSRHGSVQDQAGWGFEQQGLAVGVPARGRGVGTLVKCFCSLKIKLCNPSKDNGLALNSYDTG